MPAARLDDADLLDRLTDVFREHGNEGATLSRISAATGLQRASLYHRFPGGKDEMAAAVMTHVHERFGADVLAGLVDLAASARRERPDPETVRTAVRAAIRRMSDFYEGGERSCLLETMSLGTVSEAVATASTGAYTDVRDLFAAAARAAGVPAAAARRRAEDAMVAIEGGIVVSRVSGDPAIFRRAMNGILDRLLESPG